MNRIIADLFISINTVLFAISVIFFIFVGFSLFNTFRMAGGGAYGILASMGLQLVGVLIAVLVCGLAAVLGEVMKSLREIQDSSAKTEANSNELKRRFSKNMNGPIKRAK